MSDETTTDRLAEIEGQAADYTPSEGWRVLAVGEKLQAGDMTVRSDGYCYSTERVGYYVGLNQRYIRRIEPEPEPQPEPENSGFEGHILREQPQAVQVREGRWRTQGGEVKYIKAGGSRRDNHYSWPWTDTLMCWQDNGFYHASKPSENDLVEYLGPIQPEPAETITPDDVAAEALAGVWDKAKAEQQVEELRSEVSHVQRLLGEEKRRFAELETLTSDLRAVNAATEKAMNSAARDKADLQHRLDTVAAEWALQAETIRGLQTQLEAVKAEVVQERLERNRWHNQVLRVTAELEHKTNECRNLRIELDALQQAPQAEPVAAAASTDDRWEAGWKHGKARAVETIAEWTEPFRTCGSQGLAYHVMQNLPHIMRTLTGLADTED